MEQSPAELWPLAVLDDLSNRLDDGSLLCRLLLGCVAGGVMAVLLFLNVPHMYWLQSVVARPAVLGGYGGLALILVSSAAGITLLPRILSHVIGMATRLLVLAALCTLVGGICYEGYQLLLDFKIV
jgi:hypothetical protein